MRFDAGLFGGYQTDIAGSCNGDFLVHTFLLYYLKEGIRSVRIKHLIAGHDRHQIFRI